MGSSNKRFSLSRREADYREYSNAADLEEQLEECPCYLAEGELEYLKEMEEEQAKGEDDDQ